MRLFIALDPPEDWRDALTEAAGYLAACAPGCVPARREHFHWTLAFLGEREGVEEAIGAMDRAAGPAFTLSAAGAGRFLRGGEALWWMGLEEAPELRALQRRLAAALREAGIPLEERPFHPHLTLARRVRQTSGFRQERLEALLPRGACRADHMTLYHSHRPEGKLRYDPLCRVALAPRERGAR